MSKKALKDIPLQEITLRKYERPVNLEKRELIRRFLLSVGLLQPGESRDIIVDIFALLFENREQGLEPDKILKILNNRRGASAPNIRRQVRRLRELKLVEKVFGKYKICDSVLSVVENFIEPFIIKQSTERLKEYAEQLDKK